MATVLVDRFACATCDGGHELLVEGRASVEDSDGRSADARVTRFRCHACGAEPVHWLMPRFPQSRELWMGGLEPKRGVALELLDPWTTVTDPGALERELGREVARGHRLFGKPLSAVARRCDCDDVLFASTEIVAVIHLTWRGRAEEDPRWPGVEIYDSIAAFVERRMRPDAADYAD